MAGWNVALNFWHLVAVLNCSIDSKCSFVRVGIRQKPADFPVRKEPRRPMVRWVRSGKNTVGNLRRAVASKRVGTYADWGIEYGGVKRMLRAWTESCGPDGVLLCIRSRPGCLPGRCSCHRE